MPTFLLTLVYILIFLYGIIIGSFLNVCIYRIPKQESIVFPSSHCMECGHRLRWYDLFPLFSYLILKGRCRYCGAKISAQYPIVEALNGILYVIVFMANDFHLESILLCLMTSALLVLSVIDERTYEIPLGINIFLGILGLIGCCLDSKQLLLHMIGFICVSLPLYILYVITGGRAIGGGDIKLMAACGLLIGWEKITLAFFLACILGAFIHLIRMKVSKAEHMLAMGPYLSMGIFICSLWGDAMIGWYLALLGL